MRSLLLMRGVPGSGKAQPLHSKILLSNGEWKYMKDIQLYDEIIDGMGNKTKVIGIFPQGAKDIYEIETSDGRKTEASVDHLWKVRSQKQRLKYNKTNDEKYFMIKTTEDLIKENDTNKSIKSRCHLPLVKPIEYTKKDLRIPPYILGCLLGDGYLSEKGTLGFSNTEKDIIENIKTYIESIGMEFKKNNGDNYTYSMTYKVNHLSPLKENLIYYNLLGKKPHNKFIPQDYLLSSIEDRLELLRGLMDTDGSVNNNRYTYCTTSRQLKDDILTLIRSLGMIATVSVDNREYVNSKCAYSINIQTNNVIVSSKKHLSKLKPSYRYYNHVYIKNIKYIGKKECQCIMVDSDDKTYITDDFIVTHNTTWIKENNLEPYVLSADNIRTMVQTPVLNIEGKLGISQNNDRKVWDLLFKLLEERMQKGEFVVVDATHNNDKMMKKYRNLCGFYKYNAFVKEIDISLEEAYERNMARDEYKRVPREAVERMYRNIQASRVPSYIKPIDNLSEIDNFYIEDMSKYESILFIGDIHGCYEPLKEIFKDGIDENTAYVFMGDYIDRGLQNKEVMEFMLSIYTKPNVFCLEGNHEGILLPYSKGLEINKKSFERNTKPQLDELDLKDISRFYKKLRQCMKIKFHDKYFLATHGGLPLNPKQLTFISTHQLIKGVGDYETDIDRIWFENEKDWIQVHGHRNTGKDYPNSYSLEDEVEFGGNLKILKVTNEGMEVISYKNEVWDETLLKVDDREENVLNTPIEELNKMAKSRLIRTKFLPNNIASLNFTEIAFNKKAWNLQTIKARGLFVDKDSGEVRARSYNKFFNLHERPSTSLKSLKENLVFPVNVYKKENGYLGILSHINGELAFYSKSTNQGDCANWFRNIFMDKIKDKADDLLKVIIENNISLVFEVVDIKNDPHIISYEQNELIFLNTFENNLEYVQDKALHIVKDVLSKTDIKQKELLATFDNFDDLKSYLDEHDRIDEIEGVVVEDSEHFMFKVKYKYYNDWKGCRHIKQRIDKENGYFEVRISNSNTQTKFGQWYSKVFSRDMVGKSIIETREMFLERE